MSRALACTPSSASIDALRIDGHYLVYTGRLDAFVRRLLNRNARNNTAGTKILTRKKKASFTFYSLFIEGRVDTGRHYGEINASWKRFYKCVCSARIDCYERGTSARNDNEWLLQSVIFKEIDNEGEMRRVAKSII